MADSRPQLVVNFARDEADEPREPQLAMRGRLALQAALLVFIALAAHAVVVRGSFLYLDDLTVTENPLLRSFRGLWPIWIHPTLLPHYQPLAYSALLVEFKLFSTRHAGGYLLMNLWLHAANVVLLWTVLRKLELPGALAAAGIFAAHPVNVEAIAWISQQPLLLCGFFSFSMLLVYLRYCGMNPQPQITGGWLSLPTEPRWLYGGAMTLFVAALASHSAAVVLPGVLLILIWWERGRITRTDYRPLVPLAIVALLWIALQMRADYRHAAVANTSLNAGFFTQLAIDGRALWMYLLHLILPIQLSFSYPKWEIQSVMVQLLWWLPAAVALAGAWYARPKFGRSPFAAAMLILLSLLPAFLFRFDTDLITYVADHVAYLASAIFVTAIVGLLSEPFKRIGTRAGEAAAIVLIAMLGIAAILRAEDYRTTENLWTAALRTDPGSAEAHNQLGLFQLETKKDSVAAMNHFGSVLERDPQSVQTRLNIAKVHEVAGEHGKAIQRYNEIIRFAPNEPEAHFGLAEAFSAQGSSEDALREYQKVLELRPDHLQTHHSLGNLYLERGEPEKAIVSLRKAIEINPNFIPAYLTLAKVQFNTGQLGDAEATLGIVQQLDPTNVLLYAYAGQMTLELAVRHLDDEAIRVPLLARAERYFRISVKQMPAVAEFHSMLGIVLKNQGKLEEAVYEMGQAVKLDPNNAILRSQLDATRRAVSESAASQKK